jgi:quinol-cytochrome oxidoreductase complex cytochrome b subunit
VSTSSANRRRLRRARDVLIGTRSRLGDFLAGLAATRLTPRLCGLRWASVAVLVLLAMQLGTGVLLSLYYYPEPGAAYDSVRFVSEDVSAGWLVRGLHRWSGELLLALVLAHAALAFLRRAFRAPREFEWVTGVLLAGLVALFRFTGRLLPWDTTGQEVTAAGLRLLESVPLVGALAAGWLRGGEVLGANTLSRFFTTHVLILPWLVLALVAAHLALLLRHGLSGDEP